MSKELDDLATAYVAQIDVRQSSIDKLSGLMRDLQTAFNANEPAKAGPIAQSIADLAGAYVKLAAIDASEKGQSGSGGATITAAAGTGSK